MNNSKEALQRLFDNRDCELDSYYFMAYEDRKIIEHDLDRLEKLENENKVLREKVNHFKNVKNRYRRNEKFVEKENTKLKKAIEILNDKFKFELGVSTVKEKYYYSLEFLYNYQYFRITQEEYELLKEVLVNENNS